MEVSKTINLSEHIHNTVSDVSHCSQTGQVMGPTLDHVTGRGVIKMVIEQYHPLGSKVISFHIVGSKHVSLQSFDVLNNFTSYTNCIMYTKMEIVNINLSSSKHCLYKSY